jgi:hypothetical protein
MRFDPALSREDTTEALLADARAAWGDERTAELRPVVEITAAALWRLTQERLEPTDVEP